MEHSSINFFLIPFIIFILFLISTPFLHYVILKKTLKGEKTSNDRLISAALLLSASPLFVLSFVALLKVEHGLMTVAAASLPILLFFALECVILQKFRPKRLLIHIAFTAPICYLISYCAYLLFH